MAEGVPTAVWLCRALFAVLAAVLLFLRLLPLGSVAGGWPGPDLLMCLTFAWVLRRPDYVPALLIAGGHPVRGSAAHAPAGALGRASGAGVRNSCATGPR